MGGTRNIIQNDMLSLVSGSILISHLIRPWHLYLASRRSAPLQWILRALHSVQLADMDLGVTVAASALDRAPLVASALRAALPTSAQGHVLPVNTETKAALPASAQAAALPVASLRVVLVALVPQPMTARIVPRGRLP